jgi:multiple sugar transport system permease protein
VVSGAGLVRRAGFWLLLLASLAFLLFPLVWMALGSFKTQVDFMAYPPKWWFSPTLANYEKVLGGNDFLRFALNSLIIAVGSTLLSLVLGTPAAYGIARYRQTRLGMALLSARMAPGIAFLIPWFILFSKLRMVDTYPAVMLTHMVVVLPLVIWVLVGFFEEVPAELEDAGRIDGCTRLGVLARIALPLARPGLVAAAILGVISSWNNFIFSLVIAGNTTRTLPVAIFNFVSYDSLNWGGLTAASTIITLPVLVMAFFVQKHIVHGLTFGALKG